jgi:hypothetical protein
MESAPPDAGSQKRRRHEASELEAPVVGQGKKAATHPPLRTQTVQEKELVTADLGVRDRDPLLSDDESEYESEVEEDTGCDKPPRKTLVELHTQLDAMFI